MGLVLRVRFPELQLRASTRRPVIGSHALELQFNPLYFNRPDRKSVLQTGAQLQRHLDACEDPIRTVCKHSHIRANSFLEAFVNLANAAAAELSCE